MARRTGTNPLRRANVPSGKKLRLAPASPNVGEMPPAQGAAGKGELIPVGAVQDRKYQGVIAIQRSQLGQVIVIDDDLNPRTIHAESVCQARTTDRHMDAAISRT